jgi:hypothetical protein
MIFEEMLLKIKCVFIFHATFVQNISHSKKNLARFCQNVNKSSYKIPVILAVFSQNLNFLDTFSKKSQISNLIQIRPVGAELFHADRRTDIKIIVAFRNFAKAPNKTKQLIL